MPGAESGIGESASLAPQLLDLRQLTFSGWRVLRPPQTPLSWLAEIHYRWCARGSLRGAERVDLGGGRVGLRPPQTPLSWLAEIHYRWCARGSLRGAERVDLGGGRVGLRPPQTPLSWLAEVHYRGGHFAEQSGLISGKVEWVCDPPRPPILACGNSHWSFARSATPESYRRREFVLSGESVRSASGGPLVASIPSWRRRRSGRALGSLGSSSARTRWRRGRGRSSRSPSS